VRRALLVLSITLAGCGKPVHMLPTCPLGNDGIAIATWTVNGQPASVAACTGIDHLTLSVVPDQCAGASIDPIPCEAGRIRYDGLPRGPARLFLDAIDAAGVDTLHGEARFNLQPDPNATPAAIDLR
jgi:hypothetical protein